MLETFGAFLTTDYFAMAFSVFVLSSPFVFKRLLNISALQSTAVSLGILGTFLGIFGGMLQFDITDLDASIRTLLSGLKLAFMTPIAGIFTALMVRTFPRLYGVTEMEETRDEHQLVLIKEELANIAKGLTGDGETTLLTQIQKLRTTMSDKQDELNKSFREFAEKMLEDNKTSLIKALEDVIKDFNAKINEQFGENFKQLNEGVGKMLEWQKNYTKQVEAAVKAMEVSSESLLTSAAVMEKTQKNAEEFKSIADALKEQLEAMGAAMTGFKSLAESLKDSGKSIRDEMEEITKRSIDSLGSRLASISEKLADDYEKVQRAMSAISNRT